MRDTAPGSAVSCEVGDDADGDDHGDIGDDQGDIGDDQDDDVHGDGDNGSGDDDGGNCSLRKANMYSA